MRQSVSTISRLLVDLNPLLLNILRKNILIKMQAICEMRLGALIFEREVFLRATSSLRYVRVWTFELKECLLLRFLLFVSFVHSGFDFLFHISSCLVFNGNEGTRHKMELFEWNPSAICFWLHKKTRIIRTYLKIIESHQKEYWKIITKKCSIT